MSGHRVGGNIVGNQHRLTALPGSARENLFQRPSDHHIDQFGSIYLLDWACADDNAVLEHGHVTGNSEHFIQAV